MRDQAGYALRISSGRRCQLHNSDISSHKTKAGIHTFGRAVDILTGHINTSSVLNLVKLAQNIGFNGLGLNFRNERKSRFLHIDNRDSKMDAPFNQPAIWTY